MGEIPKQRDLEMRNDRNGLAEPPSIMLQATADMSMEQSWHVERMCGPTKAGLLTDCLVFDREGFELLP